jgi:hypothetical protein
MVECGTANFSQSLYILIDYFELKKRIKKAYKIPSLVGFSRSRECGSRYLFRVQSVRTNLWRVLTDWKRIRTSRIFAGEFVSKPAHILEFIFKILKRKSIFKQFFFCIKPSTHSSSFLNILVSVYT